MSSGHGRYEANSVLPSMMKSPEPKAVTVPPSPPASPWTAMDRKVVDSLGGKTEEDKPEDLARDPLLYPDDNSSAVQQPLFPPSSEPDLVVVRQHMACHYLQPKSKNDRRTKRYQMPTMEEYLLIASCVPVVSKSYNQNPGMFLKRVKDENSQYYPSAKRICARPGITSSKNVASASKKTFQKPAKVEKLVRKSALPKARNLPPKKVCQSQIVRSGTPAIRAPSTKRGEDVDFESLPDYSPPTHTLPNDPKAFRPEWVSNNPLDISADPNRHMLHQAELVLASTLRLSCATYLCSKRRIFRGRLNAYLIGKEFRKTDAQQKCQIDVNKASKLWAAYDRVGWFSRKFFEEEIVKARAAGRSEV